MATTIAPTDNDALLASFYHRHWLDMGLPPEDALPDWQAQALAFIAQARARRAFAGFLASDAGHPVGSACCHIVERAYPAFRRADAPILGYVWGVYVHPGHRGAGIGARLVRACLDHLVAQGCGRALLHAGDRSRPLYQRLGFQPTDELARPLL